MNEDLPRLRETLATLHAEVEAAETRDPEVRALLARALQQIADKLLAHESGTPPTEPTDTGELADVARHFEVEHPTVAATLRGVVESLSRMGI